LQVKLEFDAGIRRFPDQIPASDGLNRWPLVAVAGADPVDRVEIAACPKSRTPVLRELLCFEVAFTFASP